MSSMITAMSQLPIFERSLAIWGLGQMGVALQGPDTTLYIDPCLTDVVREEVGDWWARAYPAPVEPDAITNADFCLITHEHLDHLDTKTVRAMVQTSPQVRFVAPGWCLDILAELGISKTDIIIPPALEAITLPGTEIRLTAVPSAHPEKTYEDQKGFRWLGYLIEWNGVIFYHAGDTVIYPGYVDTLQSLPAADVAMLPVNGRDWYREEVVDLVGNLLPAEAAWLTEQLEWDVVIPGHNDMYPNNTIPMGDITAAFERQRPRQKLKLLQPGELYYYVKQEGR